MDEKTYMSPDHSSTKPSDVVCDTCTGRKRKAEQTCLQCLCCENHLDMHNILHVNMKRHKLVAATGCTKDRICPEHNKLLEVFCHTDQQCICYLCTANKHRAHKVFSTDSEVGEVKLKIGTTQREITERIKTIQKEMQELKQAIRAFKSSAMQAVKKNEKSFTELIHFIEKRQREVKGLILAQEEAAVKKAKEHLERLPSLICHLKGRDFELQRLARLSEADNGVHFLQGILSTPALSSCLSSSVFFIHPYSSFELATEAVSDFINCMIRACSSCFTKISELGQRAEILPSPALKMHQELLQNAFKLTLNLDTAHVSLRLSKENMEVTAVHQAQDYTDHPDRFDGRAQILCNEGLQGNPKYWEVEYGGSNWVCIALSYSRINRKGKRGCLFGRNDSSWGLRCFSFPYEFWHGNKCTSVKHCKPSSRIGVYLDPRKGFLEFYNVSDDMSLIYKFQTTFTEPVYAGFGMGGKGTHIKLCDLEKTTNEKKMLLSYSSNGLT